MVLHPYAQTVNEILTFILKLDINKVKYNNNKLEHVILASKLLRISRLGIAANTSMY